MHHPNGQIFELRDVVFNEGDPDGSSHVRTDESDLNIDEMDGQSDQNTSESIEISGDLPDAEEDQVMNGAAGGLPSTSALQRQLGDTVSITNNASNQPEPSTSSVQVKSSQIHEN